MEKRLNDDVNRHTFQAVVCQSVGSLFDWLGITAAAEHG